MSSQLEDLDYEALVNLYDRRSHELKTISTLVKQKEEETKRYFEICGDNPTLEDLQRNLANRLAKDEEQISEVRRRVRDLRIHQQDIQESRARLETIYSHIEESKTTIGSLNTQIKQQQDELVLKRNQNSIISSEIATLQSKREKLREDLDIKKSQYDGIKSDFDALNEREKVLQQQQNNLKGQISTNRGLIKEANSSINSDSLASIQKEINQINEQISLASLQTLDEPTVTGIDDLDQVYKDQIHAVSQKNSELKALINDMRSKADETERKRDAELSAKRRILDGLRSSNNEVRKRIEEIQNSIPTALGQITRELEMWQKKVQKAVKDAKENEEKINSQRQQAEYDLEASESKMKDLESELARARALISQQISTNESKQRSNDRMRAELEQLKPVDAKLTSTMEENESAISQAIQHIQELRGLIETKTRDSKMCDLDTIAKIRKMKDEIEDLKKKLVHTATEDTSTIDMNEDEIRDSVASLENEHRIKTAKITEIRKQYDATVSLKEKFEAALGLMTDLDDEKAFMTNELKMIREQFQFTLTELRKSRK